MLLSLCKVLHSSFLIGWFRITRFPANGRDQSVTFFLEYVTIIENRFSDHTSWAIIGKGDIPAIGFGDTRRFIKMVVQDTGDAFVRVSCDIAICVVGIIARYRFKAKLPVGSLVGVGDTG